MMLDLFPQRSGSVLSTAGLLVYASLMAFIGDITMGTPELLEKAPRPRRLCYRVTRVTLVLCYSLL